MAYWLEANGHQERIALTAITCHHLGDLVGWHATPLVKSEDLVIIGTPAGEEEGMPNPAASQMAGRPMIGKVLILTLNEWVRMQSRTLGWGDRDDRLTRAMLANPGSHGAICVVTPERAVHLSWEISAPTASAAILMPPYDDLHLVATCAVASSDAGLAWFATQGFAITCDSLWRSSNMSLLLIPAR